MGRSPKLSYSIQKNIISFPYLSYDFSCPTSRPAPRPTFLPHSFLPLSWIGSHPSRPVFLLLFFPYKKQNDNILNRTLQNAHQQVGARRKRPVFHQAQIDLCCALQLNKYRGGAGRSPKLSYNIQNIITFHISLLRLLFSHVPPRPAPHLASAFFFHSYLTSGHILPAPVLLSSLPSPSKE